MISADVRLQRIERMVFALQSDDRQKELLVEEVAAARRRIADLEADLRDARGAARFDVTRPVGGVAGEWYRRGYLAGYGAKQRGDSADPHDAWDRSRARRRTKAAA